MRISELSTATGLPVATLKYYLRLGLLPAGERVNRTSADYGPDHLERIRLILALTTVGGLSLAATARVLASLEDTDVSRADLLGVAQRALLGDDEWPAPDEPSRSRAWLAEVGWLVDPGDPVIDQLDEAWSACEAAGLGVDEGRMNEYAQAALQVARIDIASVPQDPAGAVRQVVLGTVLVDRVLASLRRLADQHVARSEGG